MSKIESDFCFVQKEISEQENTVPKSRYNGKRKRTNDKQRFAKHYEKKEQKID